MLNSKQQISFSLIKIFLFLLIPTLSFFIILAPSVNAGGCTAPPDSNCPPDPFPYPGSCTGSGMGFVDCAWTDPPAPVCDWVWEGGCRESCREWASKPAGCSAPYTNSRACSGYSCNPKEDPPDKKLTTTVSPSGSGTISPSSRNYPYGTTVTVTASPNSGYKFDFWSGNCSGTGTCKPSMTADRTVTANFKKEAPPPPPPPSPTVTGTLDASPTSGTTGSTFTFTASRTGGTATGTITYSNPLCTGGTLVSGSYSGPSDRTFQCRYSSPSEPPFSTRGGRMTIAQGTASVSVAKNVTVTGGSLVFEVILSASPSSGLLGETTFSFVPSARNVPVGFPAYTISYKDPSCGQSGVSATNFNSSTGTFTCKYSVGTGSKTARVTGTASAFLRTTLTDTGEATVTVTANAPSVNLTADSTSVPYNGSTTLRWNVQNATSCNASGGWSGSKSASGGFQGTGQLTGSATYTLTCSGSGGPGSDQVTVNVGAAPPPVPTVNFNANPDNIILGGFSILTWSSANASSCLGSGFSTGGATSNNSGLRVYPPTTTNYRISCTGAGGTTNSSATVTVTTPTIGDGDIDISIDPQWVPKGGSTNIHWEVTDHTTSSTVCNFSGNGITENGISYSGPSSRSSGAVTEVTEFTVECRNPGTPWGTKSANVYVLPTYGEF